VGIISASVLYLSINFLFVLSEIKVHFISLFAEFIVYKCGTTKNGNLALITVSSVRVCENTVIANSVSDASTTYNYFIWDMRKVMHRNGRER